MKPVVSNALLERFSTMLIDQARDLDTSITTFRGSWVTSILMYLARERRHTYLKNAQVILPISVKSLYTDKNATFGNTYNYYKEFYKNLTISTHTDLESLIYALTHGADYKVTILANGFGTLLQTNNTHFSAAIALRELKKINPKNVSFIFVNTVEIYPTDIQQIPGLMSSFLQNMRWQQDFVIDKESVANILCNETGKREYEENDLLISKVFEYAYNDPSVVQIIGKNLLIDADFERQLLSAGSIADLYEVIGKDKLDSRYRQILSSLKKESRQSLQYYLESDNSAHLPTIYLLKTNLLVRSHDSYKAMNPLFDHYLKSVDFHSADIYESSVDKLTRALTGQEQQLFNLLQVKHGKFATKDEIAQTIWGDTWQDVYSDWAIDKLVSTLRKKLVDNNYEKTIKAVRNKGIMLV